MVGVAVAVGVTVGVEGGTGVPPPPPGWRRLTWSSRCRRFRRFRGLGRRRIVRRVSAMAWASPHDLLARICTKSFGLSAHLVAQFEVQEPVRLSLPATVDFETLFPTATRRFSIQLSTTLKSAPQSIIT